MVIKNFLHLTVQPKYVTYFLTTCLVFMLLFFAGTAPDVMRAEGDNWVKPGWVEVDIAGDIQELEEGHILKEHH
jgi:hypothetical protein